MEELALGGPKGDRDCLIEVAIYQRFNFPFFSTKCYFGTLITGHVIEVQR